MTGGKTLEARIETARGTPQNPMTSREIQEKYTDCCSGILSEPSIEKTLSVIGNLENTPKIRELMDCYHLESQEG
jgi:hypothetical protein